MSCAAACGQHQSAVNVDVTGDQLYDHVRLQLKVDAMTPKTFSNASFAPGTPFKATLYVPGDGSRTVQITAQADDGRCVTGRGGPVTGTLDTGTASLVVRAVVPCEPLVPDGGAPDGSDDGGSTGTGGATAPGTGGSGAGGTGSGGRAATGGTGIAGTGGAAGSGGSGVGGAGGRGTGGVWARAQAAPRLRARAAPRAWAAAAAAHRRARTG
jgi:hypothetical protein